MSVKKTTLRRSHPKEHILDQLNRRMVSDIHPMEQLLNEIKQTVRRKRKTRRPI